MRVAVLTVSDRSARGERVDEGGPLVEKIVLSVGAEVVARAIVPDERDQIEDKLREWSDGGSCDLILTTGGTGLAGRDVTPEATRAVIDIEVPGIAEAMREAGRAVTPFASLSRQVAGVRSGVLMINLPGSPAAAQQGLESILEILPHAVHALSGSALETHPEARTSLSGPIIVAELSSETIDPEKVVDAIRRPDCGAVVTFEGRARSPSEGSVVTSLEYEAYEEHAVAQLRSLGAEAVRRFGLGGAAVIHRVGSLAPGELAMIVVTSAPHRGEAFDAARWLVERVKAEVAIWKKELTADGGRWVGL